jgi:hypothetical protein
MPGANDNYYPRDIQTAEARIAARDERPLVNQSTGGVSQSSGTASGGPSHTAMYSNCVGPASFCQVFFGS